MPLVSPEGALVAMKGSNVAEEIDAARPVLQEWRCAEPEVLTLGDGVLIHSTHALRVAWSDPARVGWPLAPTKRSSRRRRSR
jgi:16S rRNA (guanine527-N7)-methyltransferase